MVKEDMCQYPSLLSSRDVPAREILCSRDVPAKQYFSSRDVPAREIFCSRDVPVREILCSRDVPGGQLLSSSDIPGRRFCSPGMTNSCACCVFLGLILKIYNTEPVFFYIVFCSSPKQF